MSLAEPGQGVAFVSRTAKNNGVSAVVEPPADIVAHPAGSISVALSGSVLETFLQPAPFYTGFHVAVLTPKVDMSEEVKLFYCACLRANQYRYNYGRQANRSLKDIVLPDPTQTPAFISDMGVGMDGLASPQSKDGAIPLNEGQWAPFRLSDLFDIKKGKRLTKGDQQEGSTPFIGAIESNNGYSSRISASAIHEENTLTVSYNGSVAEAFFQPEAYWCSDDVNALYLKDQVLTVEIGLFLATVIRKEKYRFNYGRKWSLEKMQASIIRLPAKNFEGVVAPDFEFMTRYIQTLPFSSQLAPITEADTHSATPPITIGGFPGP